MSVNEVSPQNVLDEIAEGTLFVDVREPFEIDEVAYDIPGQIQIPLGELPNRIGELPKDKRLIIGCRSGGRSMNACQFLKMQGFEDVNNLQGGIMNWVDNGFPTK
ncbi:rhodanese-like domain-containing protein [Crocinitomix algicola]|uniref:rhodanese-like domain-containing protein n=1 Tax=Crocinitomix algicola TaxID=1740263 RepID=UPI00082E3F01|nr:rhodanese-like domain-containing protein [Crocinitomix algicola]